MAQKNEKDSTEPTGNDEAGDSNGDEFENAVTTAITGVMAQAFGHDLYDPDDDKVEIIDRTPAETTPPSEDELLDVGFVLNNRFEIVELVHAGGMSHVYKAIDRRRNPEGSGQVHVAIKMMRESVAPEQDSRLALEREAARVQRLSHPNIVNVFDFDEHEGRVYLVMEWLEGESVNSLLKRTGDQRLDQAFAWQVIEGAAAGVQHAHLNNVVHADINPANIFITTTHQVKLLDFGVARNCSDPTDTEDNRLAWATKHYASPEVLSGIAPVVEDDIFSLGCVAYRLLSGSHPFSGSTSREAMRDDYEAPAVPGLPEHEWRMIRRTIAYRRAERPKSSAVFYRSTQRQARDDVPPPQTERLWLWPTVAVAAAVLIIAGVLWANRSTPTPDPAPVAATPVSTAPVTGTPPQATSDAVAEESPVDALLSAAETALSDGRDVEPAGDSARDYFREALAIERDNAAALRGLRSISDTYVRQAEAALRAGLPAESAGALAIAIETDPENPAIEIVDYLLVAEGNQILARARAAALSGNAEQARDLLAQAEDYPQVDAAEITAIATILSQRSDEAALLGQIDRVDQQIAAGRLIEPAGSSARDALLTLSAEYGDDPRVAAATDRLGRRLLTDAALATATGEFDEAERLLGAVESLGVLEPEVATARETLRAAVEAPEPEPEAPVVETAAAAAVAVTSTEAAAPGSAAPTGEGEPQPVTGPLLPAANSTDDAAPTAAAEPAPAEQPEPVTRQSLSELGIERYVAPKFPRSASRTGASGFVEIGFVVNPDGSTGEFEILQAVPDGVFDQSAERAVSQWRFRPRENPVNARVMLSFEAE